MSNRKVSITSTFGFVLLAFTTLASHARASSTYLYAVSNYPRSQVGCAADAAALGARLHELTGVTVARTACDLEMPATYEISAAYIADAPLNVVTIFDPRALNQVSYRSSAACQADLNTKVQQFRTATNLEPLVAFCSPSGQAVDGTFSLTIEALGAPRTWPLFFDWILSSSAIEDPETVARRIASNATAQGVAVFKSVVTAGLPENRLSLGYYSGTGLSFLLDPTTTVPDATICAQQLAAVSAIHVAAGERVLGSFCGSNRGTTTTTVNVLSLVDTTYVQSRSIGSDYSSYAACLTDLDSVLATYRAANRDVNVVGGVCASRIVANTYGVSVYQLTTLQAL